MSRCAFGINGEKTQANGERPPWASLSNGEAQAAGQFPTIGIELAGVRHPFIWLAIAVRRTRLGEVRDRLRFSRMFLGHPSWARATRDHPDKKCGLAHVTPLWPEAGSKVEPLRHELRRAAKLF